MGRSHQSGWIVLRGKRWNGYYRKQVIDPTTEDVRVSIVPVRLGLKSQMTKLAARGALLVEIAKQTGKIADGRILKDGTKGRQRFALEHASCVHRLFRCDLEAPFVN
jgi:hypothetical protein